MAFDAKKLDKKPKIEGPSLNPIVEEAMRDSSQHADILSKRIRERPGILYPKKAKYIGFKIVPSGRTSSFSLQLAEEEIAEERENIFGSIEKLSQSGEKYAPQTATAFLMYSKGVSSTRFTRAISRSTLSQEKKLFFDRAGEIAAELESQNPAKAQNFQIAADLPEIEYFVPTSTQVAEYFSVPPGAYQDVYFEDRGDTFYPAPPAGGFSSAGPVSNTTFSQIQGIGNLAVDKVKSKVSKKIGEKVGGKIVKDKIKKEVIKKGLATAAGAGTGGVGALVVEATSKIADAIKKTAGKLLSALTGEEDQKKALILGGVALVGAGALLGSVALVATGAAVAGVAGIGAFGLAGAAGGIAATIGMGLLGIASAFLTVVVVPILVTFAAFVVLTIFILVIINNSAYVTPQGGLAPAPPGGVTSPYVRVEKVVESSGHSANQFLYLDNNDLTGDLTVTYTITITALQGTLTNISFSDSCIVLKEGAAPNCPNSTIPSLPQTISPAQPHTFTYDIIYPEGPTYEDSLITDTFTVTADAPGQAGAISSAFANVSIGSPPLVGAGVCPAGGSEITTELAARIPGGDVRLLPVYLDPRDPTTRLCIYPTMIVMHWSAGSNDDPNGNDATYNTLVSRNLACQVGTDTNNVELWQPFYDTQVEMAWCANSWNTYSINNEMAGTYFTDTPPPPNLDELELSYGATCEIMSQYNIPWCQIYGHYQVPDSGGKIDPGEEFLQNVFIPEIRNRCPNDPGNICP